MVEANALPSVAPMEMEEKKEVLKFAARCRDQDRQYEINNNAELDNGVYHKFVYSTKDSKANDEKQAAKEKAHPSVELSSTSTSPRRASKQPGSFERAERRSTRKVRPWEMTSM